MNEESYNIHNEISFKLINNFRFGGVFKTINPEYEYFRVKETKNPDFIITVGAFEPNFKNTKIINDKYFIKYNYFFTNDVYSKNIWNIQIRNLEGQKTDVNLNANVKGIRKLSKYTVLKNIFVRPLITQNLISKNCALIHSSAVNINEKGIMFVGRPGVFKTSIVMDLIKNFNAKYLGEENTLIKENLAYPFPLNLKSFDYKLKYFKNENPSGKIQKLKLSKYVLFGKKPISVSISKPCKIFAVLVIEKGEKFSITKDNLNKDIVDKLLVNEQLEIGIPPTHSFSRVKRNNYDLYLKAYSSVYTKSNINNIWERLRYIIMDSFKNASIYSVTVPKQYNVNITKEIIKNIL